MSDNAARDIRYGRRGGRWLPNPARGVASEPWTDDEITATARAILAIIGVFGPAVRVLRTTAAVRERTIVLARMVRG